MYANEFKTKEKQKLTELKKLTATYKTVHLISAWVITSPPPTQVFDQVKSRRALGKNLNTMACF